MVHLGLAALLAFAAAWAFRLPRRRANVLLGVLAAVAACVELGVLVREARLDARWDVLAERELTARADRIVAFLRDEGSRALDQIREVGADSDTRALLSSETALVRTARRPVFLDLMERFPSRGAGGVTIGAILASKT